MIFVRGFVAKIDFFYVSQSCHTFTNIKILISASVGPATTRESACCVACLIELWPAESCSSSYSMLNGQFSFVRS